MEPKKPKVPRTAEDKEQSQLFIETSRSLGAEETEKFETAFKKAVPPRKHKKKL